MPLGFMPLIPLLMFAPPKSFIVGKIPHGAYHTVLRLIFSNATITPVAEPQHIHPFFIKSTESSLLSESQLVPWLLLQIFNITLMRHKNQVSSLKLLKILQASAGIRGRLENFTNDWA
jgi:hypothetical protein